ncbi:type II toxin-antitoxin system HicA family toxin [Nitrosococcus oceani]|uniref:type II toxin-antitoxin system HicA family toxin n=1 Tax=Nitrosococcus oceani TaxID=1229 RepID=UPI0011BF41D4|nr:type II toxin-antitoxin system HicA family toxin [Nitrosococcus oceani]
MLPLLCYARDRSKSKHHSRLWNPSGLCGITQLKSNHVVIPHPRKDIPIGTLHNIYRQAGWKWR